ncbi:MAG: leucyl/phenylalanyl-tRNA--protein transferase [Desulfobacteraceae bacterium]
MPIFRLTDELIFPDPMLAEPEGLLAVGGDLSPERLLLAYEKGVFPWFSDDDPILWWSPDPRLVLYPEDLKISRSLARTLRRGRFQVTFDVAFNAVIMACAQIRGKKREGTWITDEMITAYCRLHDLGYAHSVETWHGKNLVGGLYGVSLGRAFFGESMFSSQRDASKVALVHLRNFLRLKHFDFIDCQMPTDHLMRLGACKVSRADFQVRLEHALQFPTTTRPWSHVPLEQP